MTAFVQFRRGDDFILTYQPGDHMAVFPTNDKSLVNSILKIVPSKTSPDTFLMVQRQSKTTPNKDSWYDDKRLPTVVSLKNALMYYLDITTPPTQHMLAQYVNLATSNREKSQLETLAKDGNAYTQWRFRNMPSLVDILTMFPSIKLDASFLLTQLPLLQPRYYSISSSPAANPDSIHLTVAVVMYKTQTGFKKAGLCSTWLSQMKKGDVATAFVRSAPNFHMPVNRTDPVIMVGPGTGIAPLRSFWQQRSFEKSQSKNVGVLSLYFGCRHLQGDNLYHEEKKLMVQTRVMTENLALSREPGLPKMYVQDLLKKNGRYVYRDLIDKQGHIYVCGDVEMAADVKNTIQGILEIHGEMTSEKAKVTLERLRADGKYHEDIFGTLKAPKQAQPNHNGTVITPPVKANMIENDVDSDDELPKTCMEILRAKRRRAIHPVNLALSA